MKLFPKNVKVDAAGVYNERRRRKKLGTEKYGKDKSRKSSKKFLKKFGINLKRKPKKNSKTKIILSKIDIFENNFGNLSCA